MYIYIYDCGLTGSPSPTPPAHGVAQCARRVLAPPAPLLPNGLRWSIRFLKAIMQEFDAEAFQGPRRLAARRLWKDMWHKSAGFSF